MFGFGRKSRKNDAAARQSEEKAAQAPGEEDAVETPEAEASVKGASGEPPEIPAAADKGVKSETAKGAAEEAEEPGDRRETDGPFDLSEATPDESYINLGSLLIKPVEGISMRIDVDQKRQKVVSVSFQKGKAMLQVQAFAAPKSRGLWPEIRTDLAQSVRSQNGVVDISDGSLGRQVLAKIPASLPDGGRGFRVARFVGIDGPRWFLRGVFSGDAALKQNAAEEFEKLFRSIIVDRGREPMAPRDLLPLRIPENAVSREDVEKEAAKAQEGLPVPSRGPEITRIG